MNVFVDSDVIISSLLSQTGAAYYLLNHTSITFTISSISLIELEKVVLRMDVDLDKLMELSKKRLKVVEVQQTVALVKNLYSSYVLYIDDAHIIAGAQTAKVNFLLTYNLKHYKISKIKENLNIQVITPALFLQYLRSLEK